MMSEAARICPHCSSYPRTPAWGVAKDIYRQTKCFHPISELCQKQHMTYEVLMGPPHGTPPIAFIGYQPGEWELTPEQARAAGYEDCWVKSVCHYAEAKWRLAIRLRDIFGAPFLHRCVGLNAIFVRAQNIDAYAQAVPPRTRKLIADFCLAKVRLLLDAIDPRNIVVIGHGTLDLFGGGTPLLRNERNEALIKRGIVSGRPAYSIPHLTGARIRRADFEQIAGHLRGLG
jgi:hypothetical protein